MENLAFICHSNIDSAIANKIVVELEKAGIACWVAPRNIQSGTTYAAAIVQGIKKSNRFIFVFSKSSNNSDAVINEIENANALKIPVIPFKIDDEEYSDSLDYYLRSKQSFKAYDKSIDKAIAELIQSIGGTLPALPLEKNTSPRKWLILAGIGLIVVVFLVIFIVNKTSRNKDNAAVKTKTSNESAIIDSSIIKLPITEPPITEPPITISFLKGTWRNEWYFNNSPSSEIVEINKDGKYSVSGVYSFLISDFEYDKSKNQIKFRKISHADNRVLLNMLTIVSNNLLIGTEEEIGTSKYKVQYTRLSD